MKQPVPSNKFLVVLMFWKGDQQQANKLAKLLADLEPRHCALADFLFVSRFDCKPDDETIRHVCRKFNTFHYVSKRRGVGWPLGCNGVFFGAMEWFYHRMQAAQIPNYKAAVLLGSDTAPMTVDWLEQLHRSWFEANEKKKIYTAGALIPHETHEHINGDCMLLSGDLKFLRWLVYDVCDINVPAGWDWVLAASFQKWGWANFSSVKSAWRRPAFTESDWDAERADGTVLYHGTKDDSLLDLVRKKLL